ncbi:hypothetical protein K2Y11_01365 [bacterium]|nr:hypothetical protein [bacterium]
MHIRHHLKRYRMSGPAMLSLVFCAVIAVAAPNKPAVDKWEATMAAFEKGDRENPPPEGGIVFVESSSIRLWDLKKSFPGLPVINRGFGGFEVSDSVRYVDRIVIKYKPRTIVFYAGDNDIAHGESPEQVASDVREFVAQVREKLPETTILFLSIKPSGARASLREKQEKANALIRRLTEEDQRFKFVDVGRVLVDRNGVPRPELFLEDQLHLNAKGYDLWNEILAPSLKSP